MPLYFFDLDDARPYRDDEGHECADDEAAARLAVETVTEIAADVGARGKADQDLTIRVRDEGGQAVYRASVTCLGRMLRK